MDCTIAASRGLGKTVGPTVIVILGSCVFRVAWVYTIFAHFHTIPALYLLDRDKRVLLKDCPVDVIEAWLTQHTDGE